MEQVCDLGVLLDSWVLLEQQVEITKVVPIMGHIGPGCLNNSDSYSCTHCYNIL